MIGHLIGSALRGFFRIALVTLFFIALGVGVSLLVAYQVTSVWPPSTLNTSSPEPSDCCSATRQG